MTIVDELIRYHRKKRDWFRFNVEHRKWHEAALQYLEGPAKQPHDAETGELFNDDR